MRRPYGFKKFIVRGGYFGIYLTECESRVSFHKSQDPREKSYRSAMTRNIETTFLQAWWVAGKPVANRIDRAFNEHFDNRCDGDRHFDTDHAEAAAFIEKTTLNMGTWTASESDMINLMDLIERCKRRDSADGPTPLAGLSELPPPDNPSVLIHFRECLSSVF